MASNKSTANQATLLWQKQAKCNAEFFALTYGALVAELLRDLEDAPQIQATLDRMGHSMGVRMVEEVLAKADPGSLPTTTFVETTELVKTAFRMFLGIAVDIPQKSDTAYTISFADNPLAVFVELPASQSDLEYSQLLAGMVRGMLEMLQFEVSSKMVSTVLRGNDTNEILVELKQILQEGAGEDYQEE